MVKKGKIPDFFLVIRLVLKGPHSKHYYKNVTIVKNPDFFPGVRLLLRIHIQRN